MRNRFGRFQGRSEEAAKGCFISFQVNDSPGRTFVNEFVTCGRIFGRRNCDPVLDVMVPFHTTSTAVYVQAKLQFEEAQTLKNLIKFILKPQAPLKIIFS